jgi:hypothetical protein
MGQPTRPVAELLDFSGGLNSAEPPDQLAPGQLAEIRNLEYRRTKGLKRRRGMLSRFTGAIYGGGFSIVSLFRHTPGQSENAMELWAASNDPGFFNALARVAAGTVWASVALADPMASAVAAWHCRGVSFNGKLFLPYDSAVDRLHVWDGTSVRRAGLSQPAAPTVANTGAGTYPAITRSYKVAYLSVDVNGLRVLSPLSAAASFTPSGAGLAARVTRPALLGEHETNWYLFGSPDTINYYLLNNAANATTFFDDTALPSTYAATVGTNAGFPTGADYFTAPISPKFLLVDGAQLLMAGSWENVGLSSSVFYTPALGTSGYFLTDDERVPTTNRIDLDPQLGGGLTGIGGPIGGTPVAFKLERTYLLNATADPTRPYTRQLLSDNVGCVSYQGIVMAEDEQGSPSLYWPSRRGYYRYGQGGLEYCGADIEDLWATVNLSSPTGISAAYHRDAGQIWIYLTIVPGLLPSVLLVFDVARARRSTEGVRGGWTRVDGNLALSTAVCMFSDTPGNPMGLRLKPYVARDNLAGAVGLGVYQADADGINRDDNNTVAYTASLVTRAIDKGIGQQFGIQNVYVQGVAESAVTLDVSIRRNFDPIATIPPVTVALATQRGAVTATGLELSECEYVQIRIADQTSIDQHWSLDRIGLRVRDEAPKE